MYETFAVAIFLFAGIDTSTVFVIECERFARANDDIMEIKHAYNQRLLKWRFDELKRQGETYRSISERSGVPQATLCDTINGTTRPFPETIIKTYKAVGLKTEYAFNHDLKRKADFHLAVL